MVKVLSRDAVQRMTGRRSSTTSNVSGGGGDSGVSQAWVEENYISKEFFNQLFTIHGTKTEDGVTSDVVITPNDTQTALSNIQAMVGLWTNSYLSALGLNPGGGGGGGATSLAELLDVTISSPQNGQALVYAYDSITGKGNWVNGNVTPDLTDYATKQWVQQQGYITSSALTGYATQSWVLQQGYLTRHQSVDGTFWGQSWSNHGTVSGNMTNVGNITSNTHGSINGFAAIEMLPNTGSDIGGAIYFHFNGETAYSSAYISESAKGILSVQGYGTTGLVVGDADNDYIQIGNARLVWDSANNALKAIKADGTALNLYATGGVSALGMSAGTSQLDAMTFNHLSIKNSLKLNGSVNIVTGSSSQIIRADGDGDCIYLLNGYTDSYISSNRYYYNQYDNIGLHGTNYNYDDSWFIDPDGCARFSRVYLNGNTYIHTNGSDLMLTIGSATYKLTKTTA